MALAYERHHSFGMLCLFRLAGFLRLLRSSARADVHLNPYRTVEGYEGTCRPKLGIVYHDRFRAVLHGCALLHQLVGHCQYDNPRVRTHFV